MMCAVQFCDGLGCTRGILNRLIGNVGLEIRCSQNAPRPAGSSDEHSADPPPPASSPKTTYLPSQVNVALCQRQSGFPGGEGSWRAQLSMSGYTSRSAT